MHGAVMHPFMRAIAAHRPIEAARLQPPSADLGECFEFLADLPDECHGSVRKVIEWEMMGGIDGMIRLTDHAEVMLWP